MSVVVDLLAAVAMLATLGVTAFVVGIMLRETRRSFRRIPTGRRRSATIRGVAAASVAVLIAEWLSVATHRCRRHP
jgi:hypothetical protein